VFGHKIPVNLGKKKRGEWREEVGPLNGPKNRRRSILCRTICENGERIRGNVILLAVETEVPLTHKAQLWRIMGGVEKKIT